MCNSTAWRRNARDGGRMGRGRGEGCRPADFGGGATGGRRATHIPGHAASSAAAPPPSPARPADG
eukprot:354746-Chlamydomonas_euryale.AAC.3